jgi:translation initiation factor eIF-2B subunit epsilon
VIGQGTSIGDRSTVANSVLGRNCKIGKNVVLDGAYIWDGAVIGDNTEVRRAIVGEQVNVGANCKVEPDVLLSSGVKISNGVTLRRGLRVTTAPREDGSAPTNDANVVGENGQGYEYIPEEDEDEADDRSDVSGLGRLSLSLSTYEAFIDHCSLQHARFVAVYRIHLDPVQRNLCRR